MPNTTPEPQITVVKKFKACEDGVNVNTYDEGEYQEIPPLALNFGLSQGYIQLSEKVDNKNPETKKTKEKE